MMEGQRSHTQQQQQEREACGGRGGGEAFVGMLQRLPSGWMEGRSQQGGGEGLRAPDCCALQLLAPSVPCRHKAQATSPTWLACRHPAPPLTRGRAGAATATAWPAAHRMEDRQSNTHAHMHLAHNNNKDAAALCPVLLPALPEPLSPLPWAPT